MAAASSQSAQLSETAPASPRYALSSEALCALIVLHIAICCLSLIKVAQLQSYIPYDRHNLPVAIALVAAFAPLSLVFMFSRFSFGYFGAFYLYTLVLGFLWLTRFSKFQYDTDLAAASITISAILFLLPALFIDGPVRQLYVLSHENFERLLTAILVLTIVTIVYASMYSFKLSSLGHIYDYREEVHLPILARYLTTIVPNALLPFVFASYLAIGAYRKAAFALLLFFPFFPVLLNKLVFFAPIWILALAIVSSRLEARLTVILSLFVPVLLGVVLMRFVGDESLLYFNLVNIRMLATPSSALDFYNDFFAHHPHTWFCQISVVRALAGCPYQEPLAVIMQNTYHIGNLNASLFATEGVASVGPYLAPLTALACGLVIAVGNKASAGLPARFILVSAGLAPQWLLNVPMSVMMVSNGAALLFLLWYITPRTIFGEK